MKDQAGSTGRYRISLEAHLEPFKTPNRAPVEDRSNAVPILIPR